MTPVFHTLRFVLVCFGLCLFLTSCKYEELAAANYPQQVLYLPTAKNGVYAIASLPAPGVTYRFTVKLAEKKVIIPLSVYRGGVSVDGTVPVTVTANADTITKLIATPVLTNTVALPADKFTLPTSVTLESGKESAPFELSVDLDYLRANPGKKLAVGVSIASPQTTVNPLLKTTVISIDPAIFKPTSDFTSKADATTPRKIAFTNTSLNALSYSWDFGDGSTPSIEKAPTYTYPAAGTYTVTLTATGITGSADALKKTAILTVL